jgi:hypothetical protein
MTRLLPAVVLFVLALPAQTAGHQLDEFLQAARIAFARDRIVLEVDLTPGANIAGEIVAALDANGDGIVQPLEANAYGQAAVNDFDLVFDGRPVRLTLESVEVPNVGDLRSGVGTMQLTVSGAIGEGRPGTRHVRFTNRHHPTTSVYLANALVPADREVQVVAQRRDYRQQQIDVEYAIAPQGSSRLLWLLFGATVLLSIVGRNLGFALPPPGAPDQLSAIR